MISAGGDLRGLGPYDQTVKRAVLCGGSSPDNAFGSLRGRTTSSVP